MNLPAKLQECQPGRNFLGVGNEKRSSRFCGPKLLREYVDSSVVWPYIQINSRFFSGVKMLADLNREHDYFVSRAGLMKSLAHPSRLMMVDELSRGEKCVCELRELVGDDISTVSKHLNVLKKAGIVEDDKRGKQVFYRLKVPCVLNFFYCLDSVLGEK